MKRFVVQNINGGLLKPGAKYIYRIRVWPVTNIKASTYKDFKVTISLSPLVVAFASGESRERVVGAEDTVKLNAIDASYDPDNLDIEYPEYPKTAWNFEFSYKLSTASSYTLGQSDSSGLFAVPSLQPSNVYNVKVSVYASHAKDNGIPRTGVATVNIIV